MPNSPHLLIHRGVWHCRLFRWSLAALDTWKGGNGKYEADFEYGTSLFHYLRVVCFYMPLVILSNFLLTVWVFFSLFVIPIEVGGIFQYLAFWLLLVLLGLFLVGFRILLIGWAGSDQPFWRFSVWLVTGWAYSKPKRTPRFAPGFIVMVKKYIVSKRQRISPNITFVEKAE